MSGLSSRNTGRGSDIDPESLVHDDKTSSNDTSADKGWNMTVVLLVVGWYVCAIGCITSSKRVLLDCPNPCLLSLTQFAVSVGSVRLLQYFGAVPPSSGSGKSLDKDAKVLLGRLVVAVGLSYCAGFLLTNLSFSLVSANFAETIKAGEPISSVLLGYVVMHQAYSPFSYGCLVLICLGVGLSCVGVDEFSAWGFLCAVASNFCFSYRAVLAKQLSVLFPGEVDELTLFSRIAVTGCAVMLPLTLLLEGKSIWALLIAAQERGVSAGSLLPLLLFNGAAYCAYNLLSFFVLNRTDIIVHAVLNVFRRMVIIVLTAYFFHVRVSSLNAAGVALALCGVLLFSLRR